MDSDADGLPDLIEGAGDPALPPPDSDGDGFTDFYVTNDKLPSFLFRNRGNGAFEETALLAGVSLPEHGQEISAMAGCGTTLVPSTFQAKVSRTFQFRRCSPMMGVVMTGEFPPPIGPYCAGRSVVSPYSSREDRAS